MKQSVKTFIIAAALFAAPAVNSFAANLDNIFGEFKSAQNVEYVKIPRFVMWITDFAKDYKSVAGNITGIKVMDLSRAQAETKAKFNKRFDTLSKGLDTMVSVNDGNDKVRIMSELKDDKFHDVYIYAISDNEVALIKLSGTFSADDIAALTDDTKNKRHKK